MQVVRTHVRYAKAEALAKMENQSHIIYNVLGSWEKQEPKCYQVISLLYIPM